MDCLFPCFFANVFFAPRLFSRTLIALNIADWSRQRPLIVPNIADWPRQRPLIVPNIADWSRQRPLIVPDNVDSCHQRKFIVQFRADYLNQLALEVLFNVDCFRPPRGFFRTTMIARINERGLCQTSRATLNHKKEESRNEKSANLQKFISSRLRRAPSP